MIYENSARCIRFIIEGNFSNNLNNSIIVMMNVSFVCEKNKTLRSNKIGISVFL